MLASSSPSLPLNRINWSKIHKGLDRDLHVHHPCVHANVYFIYLLYFLRFLLFYLFFVTCYSIYINIILFTLLLLLLLLLWDIRGWTSPHLNFAICMVGVAFIGLTSQTPSNSSLGNPKLALRLQLRACWRLVFLLVVIPFLLPFSWSYMCKCVILYHIIQIVGYKPFLVGSFEGTQFLIALDWALFFVWVP